MEHQTLSFLLQLMDFYPLSPDLSLEIRSASREPDGRPCFRSCHFPINTTGLGSAHHFAIVRSKDDDVFFGVLPRANRGRSSADVPYANYLWVEIDGSDHGQDGALAMLDNAIHAEDVFPPHIIVGSGGGVHAYWRLLTTERLDDDTRRKALSTTMRRICIAIGNCRWEGQTVRPINRYRPYPDAVSTDPARILRVPGTHNHKPLRNCTVSILRCDSAAPRLTIAQWKAFLPPVPEEARQPEFLVSLPDGKLCRKTSDALKMPCPIGARHETLRRILYSARKMGWDQHGLETLAHQFKQNQGNWPDNVDHLVRDTVRRVQPGLER